MKIYRLEARMELYKLLKFVLFHPLNRPRKIDALNRLVRWQMASRMMAGPIAFPFVEKTMLFAEHGMAGATGNWYCGLHEVEEMGFLLHMLRPGEHFLDVGANIGSYTILAAGGVGARVTAVEPIPTTFRHLECNVELNELSSLVRVCQVGLSDQVSTLRFTSGLDTVNHVLSSDEVAPSINVPVTRLDDLVGDDVPALIKIDVEGHERAVLLGARKTLADCRLQAVIMEINGSGERYGISDTELLQVMDESGFLVCGYEPLSRRLVDFDSTRGNAIFVRDRETIQRRVSGARHFQLNNGKI